MVKWHRQEEVGSGAGGPALDIAIFDDACSTVIHVKGPASARMCDVGCVFDNLGVDLISCSTVPTASSCDMTLVVVDRSDSQPLDEALKHSVTAGLQRVFHAHRQRSQPGSPSSSSLQGPGPVLQGGSSGGSSCAADTAAAAAAVTADCGMQGGGCSSSSDGGGDGSTGGSAGLNAGKAESPADSAHVSKAPSMQPSIGSDVPSLTQEPSSSRQASLDAGGDGSSSVTLCEPTRQASAGGLADAARSSSSGGGGEAFAPKQPASVVRFSSQHSVCTVPAAAPLQLQHSGSGRPLKPALRIDIPSDSDSSSSSRRQNDHSTSSNTNTSSSRQVQQQQQASTTSLGTRTSLPAAQQPTKQPPQGGFPMQDLTRRLLELGMHRHSAAAAGDGSSSSDDEGDDADASRSMSCRSGGSSISARGPPTQVPSCRWQKVERANSRSCGDLLQLAAQQQLASMQRASDMGPGAGDAAAAAGQLNCFGTSYASLDGVFGIQGDISSHSLGSVDIEQQQQQPLGVRRMLEVSPVAGLPAAAAPSSSEQRRPPPRTPSRIILSPVAMDGSGDFSKQPKLFVSIPKSSGEERRSRRGSQSVTATPRVPFTPAAGHMAMLTPAPGSVRSSNALKQLGSFGRTPQQTPLSPRAAAAAEAAAKMPYNVAVAAAQLLSSTSSATAREAAAAVVAAAAEKGDSSTPLPSPLHGSGSAARRFSSDEDVTGPLSPRVPRTSPCSFQHPPPTPVHPAVIAAAAAAITAAADAAAQSQAMAHLQLHDDEEAEEDDEPLRLPQLGLPACLSPQRRSFHVGSSGSADAAQQRSPSPVAAAAALSAAAVAAAGAGTILEGSEGDVGTSGASSSSEEWWCGELTGMCVADIMVGPIRAVSADADLTQAKQLMMQHNLPGMLVDTGPDTAPGFLTRGDFFKAMLRRRSSRKRPHKPCVRDIMGPVLVVQRDMSIEGCAQAMQEAGVRHAAVQDKSAAAAAVGDGGEGGDQGGSNNGGSSSSMASYVGLVSDAAIYRCLGLYPEEAGAAGEEGLLDEGLLGLPHALRLHSGLDSSFDSSAGTDTPLSSRSRVATPLLDGSSTRDAGSQQQQERQLSIPSDTVPSAQQSRQASLAAAKLPEVSLLQEGAGGREGSTTSSLGSVRSAAAASGGGDASKSVTAGGASDAEGAPTRSGSSALAAAGSDGTALLPDSCGVGAAAAAAADGPPDALTRYKHAAALWEVELDDLEMIKRIGEGSFGEVMLANYRGTKVAVKRLRVLDIDDVRAPNEQYAADGSGSGTSSSGGSQRAMGASQAAFRQFFEREIAILASIRHPNVVNFIGACHKPGQRCLVTEFCARGSLDQVLHKSGLALDLTKRLEFALDIVRGMACLHAQRPIIIHRDLKTANLLVSARFEVKVADFGLSRIKDASHLQVSRAGLEGTIEYCAPEVLRGEPYTERCDVYSFGVVLWELLLRQRPYSDAEVPVFLLMVNIGNGTLCLPEVPVESATPGLVELVGRCLSFSAADRPEFREVLAILEQEYRALRARQPPRPHSQQQQQQQQQQSQQHAAATQHQQHQQLLLHVGEHRRCDSASWLAGQQHSPRIAADSPEPGGTPVVQSPAGTFGLYCSSSGTGSHVPPALTAPGGSITRGSGAVAAGSGGGIDQDPFALVQQQQQPQRHRLSQGDSGLQSAASSGCGSAAPSFGFGVQQGLQPAAATTPQMPGPQQQFSLPFGSQQQGLQQHQQQAQMFSVPLPQLQLHLQQPQQVFVASACSSPRHQQPQQFAVPVLPQLHVVSAFASGNMGLQQQQSFTGQQQQSFTGQQQQQQGVSGAGVTAGTSLKPPRHKQQLSRARSLPAPHAVTPWDLEEQEALEAEGQQQQQHCGQRWVAEDCMLQIQEECGQQQQQQQQDVLLFGEESFGGLSNRSTTYSPCPSGQLCMLVESTGSSTYGSGSGPGLVQCQQAQQQVLLTQNGQQVAVHQVPVQPVLIQQPGGQLQQAFIQQPAYAAVSQVPQQQQQQQQQTARMLHRLGTPSPTPAVLGRSTPLSSSPSPGINPLPIMAAVGAAAAAARREGSGSGAGSPKSHYGGAAGGFGHDSRSSSQGGGLQEAPSAHLQQSCDPLSSSRTGSPQRALSSKRLSSEGGGGGCGTPPGYSSSGHGQIQQQQQQGHAPAAVMVHAGGPALVTPLLLQRLDSLHRSGSSSGCSPRCLHRSSSPGLQPSGEPPGQLLGLLVPGYCSGPNSPRSHSPQRAPLSAVAAAGHTQPAAAAAVHQHLSRHGSSRLAISISGSHELPVGTAAAAAGPGEGYLGTSPVLAGVTYGVPQQGGGVGVSAGRSDSCCQAVPVYGFNVVHAAPVGAMYHHQYPQPQHPSSLQPAVRRAHSTLRNDSNSRDGSRALSPFASFAGAAPADPYGLPATGSAAAAAAGAGVVGTGGAAVAAAPAGTCSRTLSPCAAVSSGASSRSLDDVGGRDGEVDVHSSGQAAAAAAAAAGRCAPAPARYVSPFAAAAARQQDDGDRDAVADARTARDSRPASPAPGGSAKHASSKAVAAAAGTAAFGGGGGDVVVGGGGGADVAASAVASGGSTFTPTRLASPFALMQQAPAEGQ